MVSTLGVRRPAYAVYIVKNGTKVLRPCIYSFLCNVLQVAIICPDTVVVSTLWVRRPANAVALLKMVQRF